MKVKQMQIEDFDFMYSLWKKVGLKVADYKVEKKEASKMMKITPSSSFVIYEGKQLVGTVLGIYTGKRAWIYYLAVHPDFQKKGLGASLLKKAEDALSLEGSTKILLSVSKSNQKVLGFYQKLGYGKLDESIVLRKNI